ncbi:MAG: hypothetical protein WCF85_15315 [Rhodospirillaceae bacterium]
MSRNTESAADEFNANVSALREDVTSMVNKLTKLVQHQTQSTGQRVSEAVGDVTDKIASTAGNAQKSVSAAGHDIESCIERNPLTSVLIAFGVGLSLGLLSRPRG